MSHSGNGEIGKRGSYPWRTAELRRPPRMTFPNQSCPAEIVMGTGLTENIPHLRAAQYVRMSTDNQKYSTENQIAAIAVYAARREIEVVKTYLDAGKSGLTIKNRPGLQQLINDVRSAHPGFDLILVYDISRWGRFQDADESAYYEYICREAGISIRYCAEEFDNDGSIAATIIKAVKRTMAAEFSRELSERVFIGKCRMTMRGFHAHGRAAYGLRRMLVDEHGQAKALLQDGQRKFLRTDRTVLVPGPAEEVETVRWIFDQYSSWQLSIADIVKSLNARGIPFLKGVRWQRMAVRTILLNEKYIGNYTFYKSSYRLKTKRVVIPKEQWVRATGAFEAIVEGRVFSAAQTRLNGNLDHYNKFELLSHLTAVWCRYGQLSHRQISEAATCPHSSTFTRVFGSLLEAFEMVGYRHCHRRPVYASLEESVIEDIMDVAEGAGSIVEYAGRHRRRNGVLVGRTLTISVHLAHSQHMNSHGRSRWNLPFGVQDRSDITILAPYDSIQRRISAYYLIPGFLLEKSLPFLFDVNPIEFEAFRSPTVAPVANLLGHEAIVANSLDVGPPPLPCTMTPLRNLIFDTGSDDSSTATLLRSFEHRCRRVTSFIQRYVRFARAEQFWRRHLARLAEDTQFISLLKDEHLDSMPALVRQGVWRPPIDKPQLRAFTEVQPASSGILRGEELLRSMRPARMHEAQEAQVAFADFSSVFAKLLIAASRPDELTIVPPDGPALTPQHLEQIRNIFRPIEDDAHSIFPVFAEQAYGHALMRTYIRALQSNDHVTRYIRAVHPRIYRRLISEPFSVTICH